MIVRDAGDAWQLVLQTDHADLAADFALQWAERGPGFDSLELATRRHDDGWAVWEQAPTIDRDSGKPLNFLEVAVPIHLAFYGACIAAVTEEDPYAGLLVSMHGAGIYRQRYGTDSTSRPAHAEEVQEQVDAFVEAQERAYPERTAAVGVSDDERWANYRLLELYDRLSLYFCMRDVEAGEEAELAGYRLEPLGPWQVRMTPFPFRESPARFTVLRRALPKRSWTEVEFRAEFVARPPARQEIAIEGG